MHKGASQVHPFNPWYRILSKIWCWTVSADLMKIFSNASDVASLKRWGMTANVQWGVEMFRDNVGGVEVRGVMGKLFSSEIADFLLTAIPGR